MIRIRGMKFWASGLFIAFFFLLVTLQVVVELGRLEKQTVGSAPLQDPQGYKESPALSQRIGERGVHRRLKRGALGYPILLWWSPLTGENGRLGRCGGDTCFFTINRTYLQHPKTKVILFYGTDFNVDSLPLPRRPDHEWALFHEESPKNNYRLFHEPAITLFNHTATFSRRSHLPLTTQYLESLQSLRSLEFFVPLEDKNTLRRRLAPLVYVQSDCDPPSDRDRYVAELMKHIAVDSYGECLRNRDLPEQVRDPSSMDDTAFYSILARYKFVLAFENAVCDDYVTEKLWRPLKLGAVPVYYGAPNVRSWLPSNKSAIMADGFPHPRELAEYIERLDGDDSLYMEFLEWKLRGRVDNGRLVSAVRGRKWGVRDAAQDNYIDAFECMLCGRVWENLRLEEKGLEVRHWKADSTHLSCPAPKPFPFLSERTSKSSMREMWRSSFEQSAKEARALRTLVDRNKNFTAQEFWTLVFKN